MVIVRFMFSILYLVKFGQFSIYTLIFTHMKIYVKTSSTLLEVTQKESKQRRFRISLLSLGQ